MSLLSSIVVTHPHRGGFKVARRLGLKLIRQRMNFESIQAWNKLVCRTLRTIFRVNHEEHVGESGSKVSPIRVMMPRRFRSVNIDTFGAVQFNHSFPWYIRQAYGEHGLIFTVNSRAVTKIIGLVFLNHLRDPSICQNVSSMN